VHEEVSKNFLLVDGFSPGGDSSDISSDGLASSELGGEGSSNGLEFSDGSSNILVLSIFESGSDVSFKRLASIVASFDFLKVVLFNEAVHESSNEKRDRLRAG